MRWDLFCRIVDNHGDAGFAWRLACGLAARGEHVRFWIDDTSTLAWLAPGGAPGVEVGRWDGAAQERPRADVVVETFGCGIPDSLAATMAAQSRPPVWIDVEYLSAQAYVERSHGLPSPQQHGSGAGLTRWFFYPGYAEGTGGLLRESGAASPSAAGPPPADGAQRWQRWQHAAGLAAADFAGLDRTARRVSLFCYDGVPLDALLDTLSRSPTVLLATAGLAARQVERALGPDMRRGDLHAVRLPLLGQKVYDELLRCCDINFVRGEDSWVQAQQAALPFVWHAYPQDDGAHIAKLEAFLERFLQMAPPALGGELRRLFAAWNGLGPWPGLPASGPWRAHCAAWRDQLALQADLVTQLLHFAAAKMLK